MRFRNLAVALFSAILTIGVTAQIPVLTSEDWRILEPKNEDFSIDTPGEMTINGGTKDKDSRIYGTSLNDVYLYVISDPKRSLENYNFIKGFVANSGQIMPDPKNLSSRFDIEFLDRFGYYNELAIHNYGDRIYIAQVVSLKKDDIIGKRFINSLRMASQTQNTANPASEPNSSVEPSQTETPISATPDRQKPFGSASSSNSSGIPTGSGNGRGNTPQKSTTPQPVTSGLRILAKPKPPYTDLARFYGINGSVTLRLTFLADGTIGSISVVNTLPFGLTESAIATARQVRFEPAMINGVPKTVTKTFQYGFTIY